ncbi:MAG: hypothetical protein JJU32_03140 [Phormidium sp. BM_Day4_Bin.17]|nr:hypothetical protein [Phormidium sp. BM_Day4_Bin.17]UCJ13106.1 MAG: hypothetical protein JWS08_04810 [Phormidium sp. PBR-2020]
MVVFLSHDAADLNRTLVSPRTCEKEFAQHRQLFLTEQGYRYHIQFWEV